MQRARQVPLQCIFQLLSQSQAYFCAEFQLYYKDVLLYAYEKVTC